MASSVSPRLGQTGNRTFRPTTALAASVAFTEDTMSVTLTDGRVLGVPLRWFPSLLDATPEQRADVRIGGGGIGLHWPELDEDLSVAGLLAGVEPSSPNKPLTEADYTISRVYRVPLDQLWTPAVGDKVLVHVVSGPDGPTLRRAALNDMPIVEHPITGEPMCWLATVDDVKLDPQNMWIGEVRLSRHLVPLDAELTKSSANAPDATPDLPPPAPPG